MGAHTAGNIEEAGHARRSRSTWRRWRGWLLLAAAFTIFLALGSLDQRLKKAPYGGFCPPDPDWSFAAADLPQFWARLSATAPLEHSRDALRPYTGEFQLRVRLATGIRPTPERWRLWLGPQAVVWGRGGTWAFCVRPGIVAHGAHWLNALGHSGSEQGVFHYRGFFYAWRDRFLVVSPSVALVQEALKVPVPRPPVADPPERIVVQWSGENAGMLVCEASDALKVRGEFRLALSHRAGGLSAPDHWEPAPLIQISTHNGKDLAALLALTRNVLATAPWGDEGQALMQTLAAKWGIQTLPADWEDNTQALTLALTGVDTAGTLPIPELALLGQYDGTAPGEHPLLPLARTGYTLPFAWGSIPGSITPVAGEAWSLCLAQQPPYWLATSREPLMAALLERTPSVTVLDGDAVLLMDWATAAAAAGELLRKAAELELLPRRNARDLDADILPLLDSLVDWGTLRIMAHAQPESVIVEGSLASVDVASSPRLSGNSEATPE